MALLALASLALLAPLASLVSGPHRDLQKLELAKKAAEVANLCGFIG
jgi:hypothetical protein